MEVRWSLPTAEDLEPICAQSRHAANRETSTKPKLAVFAPIPMAKVSSEMIVNPVALREARNAYRTSCNTLFTTRLLFGKTNT